MGSGLEFVASDSRAGRPYFLFDGDDITAWDVASSEFGPFTAFLALDAGGHGDEALMALGKRLRTAGLTYVCTWGPGCERVHDLFDWLYVDEEQQGIELPFLMSTWHDGEPLKEALWFATDCAIPEDIRDVRYSPVVIGTDRDRWRDEIRMWLRDAEALRRSVVDEDDVTAAMRVQPRRLAHLARVLSVARSRVRR